MRWEKECGQSWKRTAVTCTERCWYLADGDMFIKCAELCGCEVEEIVTERSGPPKEPDDSPPQYCQSPQLLENSTARYPESLEIRANRQSCGPLSPQLHSAIAALTVLSSVLQILV